MVKSSQTILRVKDIEMEKYKIHENNISRVKDNKSAKITNNKSYEGHKFPPLKQ
jgi:hypothetical protein